MTWILNHIPAWNSWIALFLYWLPLVLCSYGYTARAFFKVQKDRAKREAAAVEKNGFYLPSITIGTLAGYLFLTVTPIANLLSAVFDVAPVLFRVFFEWCARVLDVPLVPKRRANEKPSPQPADEGGR